jgi:hypothetical protein
MDIDDKERLVRVETKLDILLSEFQIHKDRHFQWSKSGLLALFTSLVSILIAIFRR